MYDYRIAKKYSLQYKEYLDNMDISSKKLNTGVCFLIPIHPPHYHYLYSLFQKAALHKLILPRIFLIFSSDEDLHAFKYKEFIHPIILPKNTSTGNIVTYKKFYALEKHMTEVEEEFIIVCDAEIDFINWNGTDVTKRMKMIFENKKIYGGNVSGGVVRQIIDVSASLFKNVIVQKERLRLLTNNFSLYTWWSDVPVYKRSTLLGFFSSIIGYENLNWYHFDYIVYQNYLVLFEKFEFITIPFVSWSLESQSLNLTNLKKLQALRYPFNWVVPLAYKRNKRFYDERGTFMLYHLDRHKVRVK